MVCRRYWSFNLKKVRQLGTKRGGEWVDGIHFAFRGGQIRSLLSLISYFGKGEYADRYLGREDPADEPQARLRRRGARRLPTKLAEPDEPDTKGSKE